ncbi:lysine-specific demethylase JMJ18 isoform X2 [Brachypodium distachyon]|uniref:lysine-specific demethylase JMJ18 isoform X2 n=1 Tax=Brachypodium distachyon TaxID=15368 RepID=UPI00071D6F73|nr:lysine-specific demethylase JMJ18 isoform X2 [Brachypodium distachyon]|eukprot:XP_014756923.1 lysine-specific demethylase JMJ18 isoform X2 [Brachypodium distachyon]
MRAPPPQEKSGGLGRPPRREKRRMCNPAASSEPSSMAMTLQDLCSSRSCEEDGGGTATTHGKWNPYESHRPEIDDAPVFTPTEEEFEDVIGYITSICPLAEKYGICRIVPPPSWRPLCPLKEKSFWHCTEFNTRVQEVDKLQNREPTKKRTQPRVQKKRKRRKRLRFGMSRRRPSANASESADSGEKFGFQSGSDFTLEEFQKYADEFKQQYFGMKGSDEISLSEIKNRKEIWRPSVEEIEGEYWRIVVCPDDEVEVDYGADLDTATFSSGFNKLSLSDANKQDPYCLSCWNLNNLRRQHGSVLSFETEDISGVVVPWLYVGMCFSSFCWHVEDHFLYSLNYMHFGEQKVWYGVRGDDAVKLEEAMKRNLPRLFEDQPDLLHELVTQLSPSVLKSEGIPVYRVVQNPGEFVLTLPRAYHSGFNCGFNCAEAVNVAPVDWLPHGQCAVELYREQRRKTSISHDKLLLKTAQRALRQLWINLGNCRCGQTEYVWLDTCGKNGMLTSAVKTRVKMEGAARETNAVLQYKKMDQDYDSTDRECFSCFYDLHLSAVSCKCSPDRFACLNHANLLCSCEIGRIFLLYRYSMEELNALVAALEGDSAALYQWIQFDQDFVSQSGSMQQNNMDFSKSKELCESATDLNIGCGFDDCHDLDKTGQQKEKKVQNKCADVNMENKSSPRIKNVLVRSSDTSNAACFSISSCTASEKHDKDKIAIDSESIVTRINPPVSNSQFSQSSKCLSELSCPKGNSTPSSKTTKKLFGVDIGCNMTKTSDAQVSQLVKPSTSQPDEVSRPTILWSTVEPLEYGTVMVGKNWCNHQAIFPKGFRSRVTFHSVLDPTKTCGYISEVLDAGLFGPLFKVTVEDLPEISFTHTSPMECWNSVRDRVNEEIEKQHVVGKSGGCAILSTNSVNGLEMFGFSFPPIIQAIEALDPYHRFLEYWLSKHMPPVKELPSGSVMAEAVNGMNNSPIRLPGVDITSNESEHSSFRHKSCAEEVKLDRLLKKAKLPEEPELIDTNKVFSSREHSSSNWSGSRHSAG